MKTSIVLLAVPFSAVGAVWYLYLLGYNMSIAVWVGLIALRHRRPDRWAPSKLRSESAGRVSVHTIDRRPPRCCSKTGRADQLRRLCPGPMVEESALGLDRLRISLEALPVQVPAFATALRGPLFLPVFASLIPQMIVPCADVSALMLANLDRRNAMSRHRVGLALPVGIAGESRGGRPKSIHTQPESKLPASSADS